MIKAQFKSYGSYVTDSIYQWDLNQELSISGLVMLSAPVIAYSSKAVKKAIIVQSKIVDGVINCDIPNALLQFDSDITAHLCSLENKQYKAVEKMIIPVIKRAMPADYLFTDNVPILTYEAIEADIQHFYNLGKSYTDSAKSEIDIERKRIDNLVKDTTDNVVEYKADNFLMSCKSDAQASTTETALNVFKNISSKSENLGNFITISSNSKIQIKKSGLYSFDCKVQVTGVNASTGRQYARLKINDVQKNEYMISLVGETDEEFTNFIVSLNEGDTISFTGKSDFNDTWITLYTTIHILDYDGKVKIPNITKEVSDIRIGSDGTVYDTAGQSVREQIDAIIKDLNIFKIINKPGKSIPLEKTIDKHFVYYNSTYKLLGFNTDDTKKCKIYKVEKNKKYYMIADGRNSESFPIAVFSDNLIEDGTTQYTSYILGENESLSINKLAFRAESNGYVYVNSSNANCGLFENISTSEYMKNIEKTMREYKTAVYGQYENVDIDIKENSLYNITHYDVRSYDGNKCALIEIDDTFDIIRASGYSFSQNDAYPFICFFDKFMNVLELLGDPSTNYINEILEVPYGTKYIVINARNNISLEKFIPQNGLFEKINRLSDELSKPVSFSKIKGLKYLEQKYEVKNIIISDYEILSKIIYNGNGNKITSDLFNTVLIPIDLELDSIKILYAIGVYGGAFLDSQKNWISSFSTNETGVIYNVPINTEFIAYTCHKDHRSFELGINFNLYASEQLKSQASSSFKNPWEGKKVVLLGTSVGFGSNATKSYMQEASNYLGFTLVNTSVPGLAIHTNTDGTKLIYGSTCLSIAEYKEQGMNIPDAPKDYVPGGSYNDYYRTWEHIFTEENADADLWLYAVAPNNGNFKLDDWNAFNKSSWKYNDGSSFDSHRTTFIGALLYLMDKMYTLNPNARMAFVLDSAFSYGDSEGKGNLETVSKQWGIPLVDLWGKINRSPKSLEVIKSKNGTDNHPSTFGHEKMGMMMVGELLKLG